MIIPAAASWKKSRRKILNTYIPNQKDINVIVKVISIEGLSSYIYTILFIHTQASNHCK